VIVVNTTYQAALWADCLFAMDRVWWDKYRADVIARFEGERISSNNIAGVSKVDVKPHGNSGAGAIAAALFYGAKRVILLGYDCQRTNGQAHWHGDHPAGLGNAGRIEKWPQSFLELSKNITASIEVINCSRETALNMWPKQDLEIALNG
jgi:hypothetical protein